MVALAAESDELREQLKQAQKEHEKLANEIDSLRDQSQSHQLPALEVLRERVLSSLKLGKQAPGYKAAVKALDLFIGEVRSH